MGKVSLTSEQTLHDVEFKRVVPAMRGLLAAAFSAEGQCSAESPHEGVHPEPLFMRFITIDVVQIPAI